MLVVVVAIIIVVEDDVVVVDHRNLHLGFAKILGTKLKKNKKLELKKILCPKI